MSNDARIVIHFKDLETDESVRNHIHARCEQLAEEFPETESFEVTVERSPHAVDCHGHVSGKKTRTAAHASGLHIRIVHVKVEEEVDWIKEMNEGKCI